MESPDVARVCMRGIENSEDFCRKHGFQRELQIDSLSLSQYFVSIPKDARYSAVCNSCLFTRHWSIYYILLDTRSRLLCLVYSVRHSFSNDCWNMCRC